MKQFVTNIRDMKLGQSLGLDPFYLKFGIEKKMRDGKPSFVLGKNGGVNRYLSRQMKRLERLARVSPVRFWKLGRHLLRSSKALRIVALRNVRPHWYKSVGKDKVKEWLIELNGICYRPRETFEITRTAIPKDDGTKRYINDPGVPWRMYLWMWNFMLHFFLKDKINASQHGHRPGRGSVTCWREILDNVNKHRYIYEFDYKKFHDLIGRKFLLQALLNFKFPKSVAVDLVHLCSPYVRGTDSEDPLRLEMIPGFDIFHYYRGVIQGSNIAAYLGLLCLEDLGVYKLDKGKYIGYADDGLLFSNEPEVVEEWKSKLGGVSGIEPKPEKSGWVKFDGEWKKELKFVGLALVEEGSKLRGATRSGRVGEMVWKNKETDEVWNFLKEHNGKLEGTRTSMGAPVKASAWDNRGYADLGFLSAMVFTDNLFNKKANPSKASEGVKDSFLAEADVPQIFYRKVEIESSVCFTLLREFMKDENLSMRPKLASHGFKVPSETFQCDLGGWIKVLKEGKFVKMTRNTMYSTTESFEELMAKINDPRLRNVRGHTPQNPVGFDLLPSNSTRPSPYVTNKRVLPVPHEVSLKLVDFAVKTEGKYTSEYVKHIRTEKPIGKPGEVWVRKGDSNEWTLLNNNFTHHIDLDDDEKERIEWNWRPLDEGFS